MGVAHAGVEHGRMLGGALERLAGDAADAVFVGLRDSRGQLHEVERGTRIAGRKFGYHAERFGLYLDVVCAEATLVVGNGVLHDLDQVFGTE